MCIFIGNGIGKKINTISISEIKQEIFFLFLNKKLFMLNYEFL